MSENQNENANEPPLSGSNELVPAAPAADDQTSGPDRQSREELRISTRREILHKLDQMPGLIAMGLLPPARANSMRGVYQTILSNSNDSSLGGAAAIANEDLLAILRSQPDLIKVLKPFLTKEQMDLIVREAANDQ
jgi:hypothetical protein